MDKKSHLPLWKPVKQGLLANVCKIPSILVVRHVSGSTINPMIQTLKDLMAVELWVHKMLPSQYLSRIHDYESYHVCFVTNWSLMIVRWRLTRLNNKKVSPLPIQTRTYIFILTLLFYSRALKTITVCNTIWDLWMYFPESYQIMGR